MKIRWWMEMGLLLMLFLVGTFFPFWVVGGLVMWVLWREEGFGWREVGMSLGVDAWFGYNYGETGLFMLGVYGMRLVVESTLGLGRLGKVIMGVWWWGVYGELKGLGAGWWYYGVGLLIMMGFFYGVGRGENNLVKRKK